MKTIIAGGRDYKLTQDDIQKLDAIEGISMVVSGGASGVDTDAETWAASKGILVKVFKPDWQKFGRAAGPIRNKLMAEFSDALILFPGGKGTNSMYNEAKKAGLQVYDFRNV